MNDWRKITAIVVGSVTAFVAVTRVVGMLLVALGWVPSATPQATAAAISTLDHRVNQRIDVTNVRVDSLVGATDALASEMEGKLRVAQVQRDGLQTGIDNLQYDLCLRLTRQQQQDRRMIGTCRRLLEGR